MTAKRQRREKDVIDQMLDQLDFHGMTQEELTGKDGLLRQLTSRFYERILNAEKDQYLGYKKHDKAGDHCGNSRNGYSEKTVILDDNSTTEIQVPRDRNSTFEPFLDALRVNCRQDGRTVNKALYVALAINWEGKKEGVRAVAFRERCEQNSGRVY